MWDAVVDYGSILVTGLTALRLIARLLRPAAAPEPGGGAEWTPETFWP